MDDFSDFPQAYGGPDYIVEEDDAALAAAYSVGRGGVQFVTNAPDPQQIITGALPGGLGNEPMVSVQVPAANARTWVVTLLSSRFGAQSGGVASIPDVQVPRDNQASGYALVGPYAKLQYGTAEAMEEVLFDYPWGGGTFQVTAAMVRMYGPNILYSQSNVNLPMLGAFISGKSAFGPNTSAPLTFTTGVQGSAAAGTQLLFNAPRRAVGYRLVRTGGTAPAGVQVNVTQGSYLPGTATYNPVQLDGVYVIDNAVGSAPQSTSLLDDVVPLHPQASAILVTSIAAPQFFVAVRWLLDVA